MGHFLDAHPTVGDATHGQMVLGPSRKVAEPGSGGARL